MLKINSIENKLIKDDFKVPIIGYGTYKLGDKEKCIQCVSNALDAGYRMFDTAQVYGNEKYIADAIKHKNISRNELFLISKVWFSNYGVDKTYESVLKSMENLQTSYLDFVLIHWPFGDYYAAWRELEKLYKDGLVRYIGVSNFEPDRFIDLINFNEIPPMVNQIENNIYCQQSEAHEWMKKYNIISMAYSPLGQGKMNQMFTEKYVLGLASKYKKTASQIMLKFILQCDNIVITKSCIKKHIYENIDLFDFSLTSEEMLLLKTLDRKTPIIGLSEDPQNVETAKSWSSNKDI